MKNIHVLPTDKPSRLYKDLNNKINITDIEMKSGNKQHIYITNDEEIKMSDYILYNNEIYKWHDNIEESARKIILTTDQDLIKDGVQAIDDEFLEYYVGIPFGEIKEVEVIKTFEDYTIVGGKSDEIYYKIIIPKEESENLKNFKKLVSDEVSTAMLDFIREKETLEEIFDIIDDEKCRYSTEESELWKHYKLGVMDGLQWQQKRSYNEEEILGILVKAMKDVKVKRLTFFDGGSEYPIYSNLSKWFEQFKKK